MLMRTKTTKIYITKKNWKDRNSEAVFSITGIYKLANRLEYSNCVGVRREIRYFLCQEFSERKCHCGLRTHSLPTPAGTSDHTLSFSLHLFCFDL
jgi:hypothetical protein